MRVTDLASSLPTIEQAVLGFSAQHFGPLGVEINQLNGLSINLPEEVQKAVNTRSQMSVLGVNYMQYQAGQAMTTAAANPSGGAGAMAGAGVGLGAGLGMGYGMAGSMQSAYGQGGGGSPCPKCSALVPPGVRFCPSCGNSMSAPPAAAGGAPCPKCGTVAPPGTKFCPSCGSPMALPSKKCTKCQADIPGGAKFCPACGTASPP
jgi:membrane protease subunit (stomatin/prohibitin family)